MNLPPASISTEFASTASVKPPIMKYLASAPMSLAQPPVPPTTYQYLRSGWWDDARIVAVSSPSPSNRNQETSPLISDGSEPACNQFTSLCRRLSCGLASDGWTGSYFGIVDVSDASSTSPARFIRRTGMRTFALSDGSNDQTESSDATKIIEFQIEAWLGTTSTFATTKDPARRALLWKANGLNPWWSIQRTLDDFDNTRYSCNTVFCSEDIIMTRLSDNTVVARFTPGKFKLIWGLIGTLQVRQPVQEDLLDLIFCAIYVKYLSMRNAGGHRTEGWS